MRIRAQKRATSRTNSRGFSKCACSTQEQIRLQEKYSYEPMQVFTVHRSASANVSVNARIRPSARSHRTAEGGWRGS